MDPQDPQHVYAGSIEGGVSETRDAAATWRLRNRGFREEVIVALAMSPSTPSMIYAGTNVGDSGNGVHRGIRRRTRWGPIQPGGLTDEEWVTAIAVDPLDPNTLLVGTHHGCDCDDGSVDLSTDGGLTWTEVSPNRSVMADIAFDPSDPNVVLALSPQSNDHLFRSTDGGTTWVGWGGGLTYGVNRLAIDPQNPEVVYVADYVSGVFKSTDGGAAFERQGLGPASASVLTIHPTQSATLYAWSAETGLWRTDDGGATWAQIDTNLPSGTTVSSIVLDPADADQAYAGLRGAGVWVTEDGGETWTAMNDGLSNLEVGVLGIDPDGAILYAGTGSLRYDGPGGNGVFQIRLP